MSQTPDAVLTYYAVLTLITNVVYKCFVLFSGPVGGGVGRRPAHYDNCDAFMRL